MATGFVRDAIRTRSVHAPNDAAINEVLAEIRQLEAMIGAGAVAHAASHHSGGADALALDSIAGTLTATKLTGTIASARLVGAYTGITGLGTLTGLTMGGDINAYDYTIRAFQFSAVDEVGDQPTVLFNASSGSIRFGPGGATVADCGIGRIGVATAGSTLGTLDADTLEGQAGAHYHDLANATGTSPSTDFIESAQDAAGALWSGGGQVTYNDATPSLAISALAATLLTGTIASARLSGSYTGITALGTLTSALAINVAAAGSTAFTLQYGGVSGWRSNAAGGFTWFAADGSTDATLSHTPGTAIITCTSGWTFSGTLRHTGTLFGGYGVSAVARPSAITQTYATADKTHAARTAAALADSVGGSVGTTLAAIPDPADAPADADALRDDLVTNVLPKLRDAISSLADQVNKGRVDALDSSQLLNSVIDDLQSEGWLA